MTNSWLSWHSATESTKSQGIVIFPYQLLVVEALNDGPISVLFSQGERPILLIIFTATRCGIRIGLDLHIFLVWLAGWYLVVVNK